MEKYTKLKAAQTLLIQAQGLCDTEVAFEEVSLAYSCIQDAIEAEHEDDATREKRREEADDRNRDMEMMEANMQTLKDNEK